VVFAKEHLAVIGVVCAVAAAFAVTQLFGARTIEVPLTTATVVDEPNKTALSSTAPPTIAVHVLGAVVNPGVVVLPENARVQEAILACGGLAADAEPAELNFAQVLFDGEQLVIGTRNNPRGEVNGNSSGGTAAKTTSGSATGSRLNLNAATQAQLETLPGVGPVTAGRIIAWREQHGRFSTTAELQEVSGIGVKTYAQLEPYVSV
jgi:competence protein ComEA